MGRAVMIPPDTVLADRYRIRSLHAAGGMAEIYAATDERLRRDVAVKLVRSVDGELARRLERESVILARLDHPNIVRIFDADVHEGMPFIVMEFVDGTALSRMLADGPLPPERVAEIGTDLAAALTHAHAQGITHRDIKPSNVLVEGSGRARLADFGIARATDGTSVTATGVALGSAPYIAPEQLSDGRVTSAADIYSTGLVLLEAHTGEAPFTGSEAEAALARLHRDPDVPADLDAAWASLLSDMTRRDPSERPTAEDVQRRLGGIAEGVVVADPDEATAPIATVGIADATATVPIETDTEPTSVMPTPPPAAEVPAEEPAPPRRRHRRLVPLLLGALVLVAVVALIVVVSTTGDDNDSADSPSTPTTLPPPVADEGLREALDHLEETLEP